MAIDTQLKRASSLLETGGLLFPDAAITSAEFPIMLGQYSAAGPGPVYGHTLYITTNVTASANEGATNASGGRG